MFIIIIKYQTIGKWCISFKNGRTDIEDDYRDGKPSTVTTNINIERIKQLIDANRWLSIDSLKRLRHAIKDRREMLRKALSSSTTMSHHIRHDSRRTCCKNLNGKCDNILHIIRTLQFLHFWTDESRACNATVSFKRRSLNEHTTQEWPSQDRRNFFNEEKSNSKSFFKVILLISLILMMNRQRKF